MRACACQHSCAWLYRFLFQWHLQREEHGFPIEKLLWARPGPHQLHLSGPHTMWNDGAWVVCSWPHISQEWSELTSSGPNLGHHASEPDEDVWYSFAMWVKFFPSLSSAHTVRNLFWPFFQLPKRQCGRSYMTETKWTVFDINHFSSKFPIYMLCLVQT